MAYKVEQDQTHPEILIATLEPGWTLETYHQATDAIHELIEQLQSTTGIVVFGLMYVLQGYPPMNVMSGGNRLRDREPIETAIVSDSLFIEMMASAFLRLYPKYTDKISVFRSKEPALTHLLTKKSMIRGERN